MTVFVCNWH